MFTALILFLATASALPSREPHLRTPLHQRNPVVAGLTSSAAGADVAKSLWYNPNLKKGAKPQNSSANYQCFNGEVSKYPKLDQWLSFEDLWATNKRALLSVNTPANVQYLHNAVVDVSKESGVDPRFILAMALQESSGKVDVHCTQGPSHQNCGLLQASIGSTSFDPSRPEASIKQMLREGILGTSSGDGLVQFMEVPPSLAYTNNRWPANPFTAARAYNSGRIAASGNLDEASAGTTSAYTNDIANRLVGWDGTGAGCVQVKCGLANPSNCAS